MENPSTLSLQGLQHKIARINERVAAAAMLSGRAPADIGIMAVTKTQPPELVNAAIAAGIKLLGENRAQELVAKHESYTGYSEIHFIGHLQRNKVRQVVDRVDMIQSVDRLPLAQEIDRLCRERAVPMPVLVEVNIGGEESKSGVAPEALGDLLHELRVLRGISVRGLMCVPPRCDSTAELERHFERMYKLFVDTGSKKIDNIFMQTLSMGMSSDYEPAIKHGANLIRLGTALFGERG